MNWTLNVVVSNVNLLQFQEDKKYYFVCERSTKIIRMNTIRVCKQFEILADKFLQSLTF